MTHHWYPATIAASQLVRNIKGSIPSPQKSTQQATSAQNSIEQAPKSVKAISHNKMRAIQTSRCLSMRAWHGHSATIWPEIIKSHFGSNGTLEYPGWTIMTLSDWRDSYVRFTSPRISTHRWKVWHLKTAIIWWAVLKNCWLRVVEGRPMASWMLSRLKRALGQEAQWGWCSIRLWLWMRERPKTAFQHSPRFSSSPHPRISAIEARPQIDSTKVIHLRIKTIVNYQFRIK